MAKVDQLIIGYNETSSDDHHTKACGSVTLIQSTDCRILVDCGNPWIGQQIIDALAERSLCCDDITHLVITHGHSDHCGNLSLFKNAQIYMDSDLASPNELYTTFPNKLEIDVNVYILRTPGHTDHDLAVVVSNTERGLVVVAGDIFEDGSNDNWREQSRYEELQKQSRKEIEEIADWIIPGHGAIFRNCKVT